MSSSFIFLRCKRNNHRIPAMLPPHSPWLSAALEHSSVILSPILQGMSITYICTHPQTIGGEFITGYRMHAIHGLACFAGQIKGDRQGISLLATSSLNLRIIITSTEYCHITNRQWMPLITISFPEMKMRPVPRLALDMAARPVQSCTPNFYAVDPVEPYIQTVPPLLHTPFQIRILVVPRFNA
ncbi:hypothetical protein SODALDRAFT_379802 [Sodiomyces alkalinus F11]|uniref:Uncharacterized protein n=1 Tax=Sodiomyces alkalinus (strain CBS 110278 / VKM F-3762 / F11) TaxID=1314773 RepID=A0A3N2PSD3_SODAK|nr:hypothetical protein SODALDRAFT_379802 [Sodiomyces alkalinus F11]ROT37334.1 hypothetical protein SODALDRAFT_379802 [Sodiomyces alkalinus F11]